MRFPERVSDGRGLCSEAQDSFEFRTEEVVSILSSLGDVPGARVSTRRGFGNARYGGKVSPGGRAEHRRYEQKHACPVVLGARYHHVHADCLAAIGISGTRGVRASCGTAVAGVVGVAAAVSGHIAPDSEQLGPDGDVVPAAG